MTTCPTPAKRRYPSKLAAIRAAIGSSSTFGTGMRTYRCTCGAWHVTHKTPRWSNGRRA